MLCLQCDGTGHVGTGYDNDRWVNCTPYTKQCVQFKDGSWITDFHLPYVVSVQLSSLFYQHFTIKLFILGKCIKTDRTELKNVCCNYAIISTSIVNINTP